jgi:hypothetical protein
MIKPFPLYETAFSRVKYQPVMSLPPAVAVVSHFAVRRKMPLPKGP